MPAGPIPEHLQARRAEVLQSVEELNETLFELRETTRLPGSENSAGKRKRGDESYWIESANDSLALSEACVLFASLDRADG